MFVKLLGGPNAGKMVEMKYADARALLDTGRAVLGYPPDTPPPPAPHKEVSTGKTRKQKK